MRDEWPRLRGARLIPSTNKFSIIYLMRIQHMGPEWQDPAIPLNPRANPEGRRVAHAPSLAPRAMADATQKPSRDGLHARRSACGDGAAARQGHGLSVGRRAEFRDHRAVHDRGSLRGRRRDRARGSRGAEGRARRPPAAGGLSRADRVRDGALRLRRCGRCDHAEDDPPASACVRRLRAAMRS